MIHQAEISLISVPYKDMNCWELVARYLKVDVYVPEDVNTSGKAKVNLYKDLQHRFTQIDPKDIIHADIVLHGTHVAIWIDNAAGRGFLHAIDPFSEFVPVQTRELAQTGLNGNTVMNFRKPTFWRLNK